MDFKQIVISNRNENSVEIKKKPRIAWIDATRAFAIFCIVLGHVINGNGVLWHIVYGFHVPLFLILGGMTFSIREENMKNYICRKFRSIMLPYYFWGFISICIYILIERILKEKNALTIYQCLVGLLVGNAKNGYMHWNTPMWYLPMYFCVQIVSYFLYIYNPTTQRKIIYGVVSFGIAWALYLLKGDLSLPFGLSTTIFLYPFFIIGTLINPIINLFESLTKSTKVFLVLVLIIISGYIIVNQKNIDYVTDVYRQYPLFVVSAIGMSLGTILFIKYLSAYAGWVQLVGANTLGIMILQKFPIFFFVHICPGVKALYLINPQVVSLFISIITVWCCTLFSIYGSRYMPWLFGRNVKRDFTNKGADR